MRKFITINFILCYLAKNGLKANENVGIFKFGAAEKKLILVFCYYIILSSIALTAFTLSTRNAPFIVRNIGLYFLCEQSGHDPAHPCIRDHHQYSYQYLSTLSYVLLSLFPVVNLIFTINLKELKDFLKKVNFKRRKHFTT